ncbi:MAG TPA: hypothetical protein VN804_02960, partial [Solirubrobacteraceae bacterium]|nr:hypothetical protein [Solirubrobacteraceae bacterium]
MLRFFLWRLLGVAALLAGYALLAWFLRGGLGALLREASVHHRRRSLGRSLLDPLATAASELWRWTPALDVRLLRVAVALVLGAAVVLLLTRTVARQRRRYVRLLVAPYRTDAASAEAVVSLFEAIHKRMLPRWWRRACVGSPALSLEIHYGDAPANREAEGVRATNAAWMAVACPCA